MTDIRKLVRIQILVTILFVFFKFIRPSVLKNNSPEWTKLALLSLPNLFEAIVGTLTLTGIGIYLNQKIQSKKLPIKENVIYLIALIITGIYVITQELKMHNLGGNNVYDKNDLIFSIIGLVLGYTLVIYIQPKIHSAVAE